MHLQSSFVGFLFAVCALLHRTMFRCCEDSRPDGLFKILLLSPLFKSRNPNSLEETTPPAKNDATHRKHESMASPGQSVASLPQIRELKKITSRKIQMNDLSVYTFIAQPREAELLFLFQEWHYDSFHPKISCSQRCGHGHRLRLVHYSNRRSFVYDYGAKKRRLQSAGRATRSNRFCRHTDGRRRKQNSARGSVNARSENNVHEQKRQYSCFHLQTYPTKRREYFQGADNV